MKKETLTMEAIKSDLIKIVNYQVSNKADWRFSYIVPFTALAIFLGVFTKSVFIGMAVFCVAAYHIARFIIEYKAYKAKKAVILSVIERGEISITTETLSHIANDVIYEPHSARRRAKLTKIITLYHFDGGSSWRIPTLYKHYEWSKEYYISSKGLENISIKGDEFYFVSLQSHHDIAYIYPCKNFELDEDLKK
jgi:hypothetical protein